MKLNDHQLIKMSDSEKKTNDKINDSNNSKDSNLLHNSHPSNYND